jgi:hypothetical protein
VAPLAGESSGALTKIIPDGRVRTARYENLSEIATVCSSGRKDGGKTCGLPGVGIGSGIEQQLNRLRVATQGQRCMERLIRLRVFRDGIDWGAVLQQKLNGLGSSKCRG